MRRRRGRRPGRGEQHPAWLGSALKDGKLVTDRFCNLDSFDKVEFVAEGRTSRASVARLVSNGKFYCLKGIRKKWIFSAKAREHVRRQLRVHMRLHNRFIANVFRVFDHHSFVYIVQEYCLGGTLESLLDQRKRAWNLNLPRLRSQDVRFYVAQIASAIGYMHHTQHVAHRNLMLSNVGLSWCGHVKLIGFGAAVDLSQEDPEELETLDEDVMGMIDAVAPELLPPRLRQSLQPSHLSNNNNNNNNTHSYEVDWWALGVVAFQLAFGYAPFGSSRREPESAVATRIIGATRKRLPVLTALVEREVRDTGLLDCLENLLCCQPEARWGMLEMQNCDFLRPIENWGTLHKLPSPWVPSWSQVEGDTSCFAASIRVQTKSTGIGVFPQELRNHPSPDEINYCYFTDVCRDVMAQAFSTHTVTARREWGHQQHVHTRGELSPLAETATFQKLQRGFAKKRQRDARKNNNNKS